jgi:hypothetical protein
MPPFMVRTRSVMAAAVIVTSATAVTGSAAASPVSPSPIVVTPSAPPARIRTPSVPLVLDGRDLRAPTRTELGRLTGGAPAQGEPNCVVDFDDDDAVELIGGALYTFVYSPWWNQVCSDSYVRVVPTNLDHFHLTYQDPDVTNCLNADNEYGTALGEMARGAEECEPIDPVTEPRGYLHSMFASDIIAIERIDLYGSDYTPRPFTFERIKVVDAGVRVCFQLPVDGPWEAAEPPGPGDHPAQYCWPSLDEGTWDLSAYTSGAVRVTVTSDGDGSANFSIDNLWMDW